MLSIVSYWWTLDNQETLDFVQAKIMLVGVSKIAVMMANILHF